MEYVLLNLSLNWVAEIVFLLTVCLACFLLINGQKNKYELNLKKKEMEMNHIYETAYRNLLAEAGKKQDDYRKQLSAIYNMGLMAVSKEELVDKQAKYVEELKKTGKYDIILTGCENPLLAGYLYYKCMAVENAEIAMDFCVCVGKAKCMLSVYEIIEVLAVFMDHVVESLSNRQTGCKKMMLKLKEDEEKLFFEVGNPEKRMSEEEMGQIFQNGCFSKGKNQGLGLSRIKKMAGEHKLQLMVSNSMKDGLNWLVFQVVINKKNKIHC